MFKIKTFPLKVTEDWLDEIEDKKDENESKHDFIIKAVDEKLNDN